MEYFTRVLSGNSRTKERSREAQQITETFDSSLKDDLKVILDSEESIHVNNLLDMIYNSSFPEEQKFMKMPSQDLLKSKKDLVVRLLIGLDALGVPSMADMLVYIKKHGMEGIEEMLINLFQLMSPRLEEKQLPAFTADDVLDAMDSEWHCTSGVGSPLLSVIASATSSPRGSAASISDTQFLSSSAGSPFRRVLSDHSMLQSRRAHELRSKTALDKPTTIKSSASPNLATSVSAHYPTLDKSSPCDELGTFSVIPTTLASIEEKVSDSNSQDSPPKHCLQKKHRRKSSSLRQLFADEAIEDPIESSVCTSSEHLSQGSSARPSSGCLPRSSSMQKNPSEVSLYASGPSSPSLDKAAQPVASENKGLLRDTNDHVKAINCTDVPCQLSLSPQTIHPSWREDSMNFYMEMPDDDMNRQNTVDSTGSQEAPLENSTKTFVENSDARMGKITCLDRQVDCNEEDFSHGSASSGKSPDSSRDMMQVNGAAHGVVDPATVKRVPLLQTSLQKFASYRNCETTDEIYGDANDFHSDQPLQAELKHDVQHNSHKRRISDDTHAKSSTLFREEVVKEEELIRSQSDNEFTAKRLRRNFVWCLGSTEAAIESLVPEPRGVPPDRAMEVVLEERTPWTQMSDSGLQKAEDCKEEQLVSPSTSDQESRMTVLSFSSTGSLGSGIHLQSPDDALKAECPNDDYAFLPHQTFNSDNEKENASNLPVDIHLQDAKGTDTPYKDSYSHGDIQLEGVSASPLPPSTNEIGCGVENVDVGSHGIASNTVIQNIDDKLDDALCFNSREDERTGGKNGYDSMAGPHLDNDSPYSTYTTTALPVEANEQSHCYSNLHSQTVVSALTERANVSLPSSRSSSNLSIFHSVSSLYEGGGQIADGNICDLTDVSHEEPNSSLCIDRKVVSRDCMESVDRNDKVDANSSTLLLATQDDLEPHQDCNKQFAAGDVKWTLPVLDTSKEIEDGDGRSQMHEPLLLAEQDGEPEIHTSKPEQISSEKVMSLALPTSREEDNENVQVHIGKDVEDNSLLDSSQPSQQHAVLVMIEPAEHLKHVSQNSRQVPQEIIPTEDDEIIKDDTAVLVPSKTDLHEEIGSRSAMHKPPSLTEQDDESKIDTNGLEQSSSEKLMPSGLPASMEKEDEKIQMNIGRNVEDIFLHDSIERSQLGEHLKHIPQHSRQLPSKLIIAEKDETIKDELAVLAPSERDLFEDNGSRSVNHEPLLLAEQDDELENDALGPEQRFSKKRLPLALPFSRGKYNEDAQMDIGEHAENNFLLDYPELSQQHQRGELLNNISGHSRQLTSEPNTAEEDEIVEDDTAILGPSERHLHVDNGGRSLIYEPLSLAEQGSEPEIHTLKPKQSSSERLMLLALLVSREEDDKNVQMTLGQNLEDIYRLDSLEHSQEPPVLAKTEPEENLRHIFQNCRQLPSQLNTAEEYETTKDDTSVLTPGERDLHIDNGSRSVMHEPQLSAEQDEKPEIYPVGPELSSSGKEMPSGLPVCREEDDEFAQTHAGKNVEESFLFDSPEQSQQHPVLAKIELGDHLRHTSLQPGQLPSKLFSAEDAESSKDEKAVLSRSKMDLQVDKSGPSLMHEPLLFAEQGDGPEMHTLGPEQRSSEKVMPRVLPVSREEDAENVQMYIAKNVEESFLHGFPQHFQPHNVLAKIDLGEHFNQVSRHSRELPSELTTLAEDETIEDDKAVRVPLLSNSENEGQDDQINGRGDRVLLEDETTIGPETFKVQFDDAHKVIIEVTKSEVGVSRLGKNILQPDIDATAFNIHPMSSDGRGSESLLESGLGNIAEYSGLAESRMEGKNNCAEVKSERDFADIKRQFVVRGPEPVTAVNGEQEADPAIAYELNASVQDGASMAKKGLESSNAVHEVEGGSLGEHAYESGMKDMDAAYRARERVDTNPDDADRELESEGLCQNDTMSTPCWEASEAVDASGTHPLQLHNINGNGRHKPSASGVLPHMTGDGMQMPQANVGDEAGRALHGNHVEYEPVSSAGSFDATVTSHVDSPAGHGQALNQPDTLIKNPDLNKWDSDGKAMQQQQQPKRRRRGYVSKLMHGCLSCCGQSHVKS